MMRTKNVKSLEKTSPSVRDRVLRSGNSIPISEIPVLEQPSTFKNLGEPVVCTKVRFIGGEKKRARSKKK